MGYPLKSSISAAVLSTFLASPALAADVKDLYYPTPRANSPAAAGFDWSGLYVGVNGGYGWGERETSLNENCKKCFDPAVVDFDSEGWMGGVTVGANAQRGSIVFGIETDFAVTSIESSDSTPTAAHVKSGYKDGYNWDIESEVEYFGTLRGRVGYLLKPSLLAYGTGGLAWARVNETHHAYDHVNGVPKPETSGFKSEATNDHFGWTAGGGLEWEFQPGWTLKGEYLYVDLGEVDYVQGGDVTSADLDFHAIRAGLNWRF